ncbi:hypothetical protein GCM10027294_00120 [Marinactinospora endophytica]
MRAGERIARPGRTFREVADVRNGHGRPGPRFVIAGATERTAAVTAAAPRDRVAVSAPRGGTRGPGNG